MIRVMSGTQTWGDNRTKKQGIYPWTISEAQASTRGTKSKNIKYASPTWYHFKTLGLKSPKWRTNSTNTGSPRRTPQSSKATPTIKVLWICIIILIKTHLIVLTKTKTIWDRTNSGHWTKLPCKKSSSVAKGRFTSKMGSWTGTPPRRFIGVWARFQIWIKLGVLKSLKTSQACRRALKVILQM